MVPTPTTLPDLDANDALLLSAFQQQFVDQHQQVNCLATPDTGISILGDCDPTPIANMNFTGSSNGQQTANSPQQQLLELVQAMQQNSGGLNNNNANNSVALLQQQMLQQQQQQQQQQQSFTVNANTMANQNQQSLQSQLANLLGNQQQQQNNTAQQRQHSLSLVNLDVGLATQQPRQRQQSLSLGTAQRNSITGVAGGNNANALLAFQLAQQQQPRTNNNISLNSKPSAVGGAVAKRQKKGFLLFIKILLRCLSATQNHVLKERTKAIVSECTRRNRIGDPAYMPLQTAVEQRLRPVVGEQYWTRAQKYVQSYYTKQPQLAQRVARVRQQQQLLRMATRV